MLRGRPLWREVMKINPLKAEMRNQAELLMDRAAIDVDIWQARLSSETFFAPHSHCACRLRRVVAAKFSNRGLQRPTSHPRPHAKASLLGAVGISTEISFRVVRRLKHLSRTFLLPWRSRTPEQKLSSGCRKHPCFC